MRWSFVPWWRGHGTHLVILGKIESQHDENRPRQIKSVPSMELLRDTENISSKVET